MRVPRLRRKKAVEETAAALPPVRKRLKKPTPITLERIGNVYVRRLNDIHVATQTTIAALERHRAEIAADGDDDTHHNYTVPSSGERETANIRRRRREVRRLLGNLIAEGEPGKSLLLAVSVTEDFVLNALKLILRAHPDRMNRGVKGGESDTAIKLDEFLTRSRDDILEDRIRSRLHRALHASPADYLKYLADVLEVEVDVGNTAAFIEAKATRDILVHADGFANEKYLEKAGDLKRAAAGERLRIDLAYLNGAMKTMKTLVSGIHAAVQERYREDEAVNREVARFLK